VLDTATPATGWDVRDAVSHLMGSDREATKAATWPELFVAELPEVAQDIEGFLGSQLEIGRALDADALLDQWPRAFAEMLHAFAGLDPATRVPWYGPAMSPTSFVTARLMEYWAHGQDIADGLGIARTPTDRLRHVCDLGVRTYAFAHLVRGLAVPKARPRITLEAPGGGTPGGRMWEWGSGPDAIEGPALDFALRVTQRRHRDDTALVATGPLADAWLDIAQCFAGPPGPGRPSTRVDRP